MQTSLSKIYIKTYTILLEYLTFFKWAVIMNNGQYVIKMWFYLSTLFYKEINWIFWLHLIMEVSKIFPKGLLKEKLKDREVGY